MLNRARECGAAAEVGPRMSSGNNEYKLADMRREMTEGSHLGRSRRGTMNGKTWKVHRSKSHPGWLTVIGPHDEDFKQAIKSTFRHEVERQWHPGLGVWMVHESRHDDLLDLIDEHTETATLDAMVLKGIDGARALLGRAQDLGEVVTSIVSEELAEALSLGLEVLGEATPASTGDLVAVSFDSGGDRLVFVGAVMKVLP